MKRAFPFYKQIEQMDCLPTCLRMVAAHHGRHYSSDFLRRKCYVGRSGASLAGISDAAEAIGLRTLAARVSLETLIAEAPLPCIVHWKQKHFVVVYATSKRTIQVADPAHGLMTYTPEEFRRCWIAEGESDGVALFLEPTAAFHELDDEPHAPRRSFSFLFSYLRPYKPHLVQLLIGMAVVSLLQLFFPFLTQAIVDFGIANQNLGFVYLVLIAQLVLFASRASVELIRGWILLHMGSRINIAIVSDFLAKLMRLPLSFFDSRKIGDILERVGDHQRLNTFLTSSSLNTLFSLFSLLVFGVVVFLYSGTIFLVFLLGSVAVAAWIIAFQRKRRELDYRRFNHLSDNQTHLIQLVIGMQEIKLNGSEIRKRWEWEHSQARLFRTSVRGLVIGQYQQAGSLILNELKNILITFIAAREVIEGRMTLGMMMAVTYVVGQLNGPIEQLLALFNSAQDARLGLERIGEVYAHEDEDAGTFDVPAGGDLEVRGLSFQYEGPRSPHVLRDVDMVIPTGRVTAIVGASGSGKTTLLKLLLKVHAPTNGSIRVGSSDLAHVDTRAWRMQCGVVMQDGYIFTDTILRNIAMADENVTEARLMEALRIANLTELVEALPLGLNTKIGTDGHGLSQGQKQRILIARAVYKQPEVLFFDEATSALDATNERRIMRNLEEFFRGRTVVVIAHRLSTVRHADQILVLDRGTVVERGTHDELTSRRDVYFQLVRNQLELGQ